MFGVTIKSRPYVIIGKQIKLTTLYGRCTVCLSLRTGRICSRLLSHSFCAYFSERVLVNVSSLNNSILLQLFPKMARQLTKLGYLDVKKTLFMLCDLQDKFRPGMKLFDPVVKNTSKLVSIYLAVFNL